jgi:Uma2 family endonuclease
MATVSGTAAAPVKPVEAAVVPAGSSPVPAGPIARAKASSGIVLRGVSFATYKALRAELDRAGDRARLTFDRGMLEIMTQSYEHEQGSLHLCLLIVAIATELDILIEGGGTTTFAREDLDRGIEPDQCFYIANEPSVRGKKALDLANDPPPDLVIEVDVSRSSLSKTSIYAAIGTPEFWRLDERALEILELDAEGRYQPVETSRGFPFLKRAEVEEWLRRRDSMGLPNWLRELHTWVRNELAPRLPDHPGK